MTNRIRRSFKIRSMDSEFSEFDETPSETQKQGQRAKLTPLSWLNLKSKETPVLDRRTTRLFSPPTRLNRELLAMYDIQDVELMQLDFRIVKAATGNFSSDNKLGQGGFGCVYKGTLPNGQDIAVKRLSWSSGQGELEFKNEVIIGAKILHRNLVRIQGFCFEKEERLLVYEFLPNSSLNNFISDPVKRVDLDWETRYKIIEGIAKGLLYLHEDSGLQIIHLDLKASNILLDAEMNPKITDFGLSRSLSVDKTSDNTFKIAGTFGYMAPEYMMYGQFSVKSDVYSFGVLILEIISGKKSYNYDVTSNVVNLVSYVWKHWRDGTPLEVLDPTLTDTYARNEVIRCIQVGLLCVQKDPESRPKMATVVPMLNINPVTLPLPQDPECSLHETPVLGRRATRLFSPLTWLNRELHVPVLEKRLNQLASMRNAGHLEEFSLQVLLEATNNFSQDKKIGTGSFGSVYQGRLDDGREVAIKRAEISNTSYAIGTRCQEDKDNAFINELESLSRLHHKNLVRLLGLCEDSNERVLVYEYMHNGTLHDHLHKLETSLLMSWVARIKVALDAARGIEYLHRYAVPPIIHRDIKSSNILLDSTGTAKVSDFIQSVMGPEDDKSHLSLHAAGTVGYMDPEYYRLQQLTTKSDVYSFGVVLLEILFGYKAIHKNENGVPRNVVDFAVPYIIQDEIHGVLDSRVPPPTPYEIEAVTYVGYLAADCVALEGRDRPSMTEVVNCLERALAACLMHPNSPSGDTTGSST